VASAIPERVELLGITEIEPRLLAHPSAQAYFERAVLQRREGAERQSVGGGCDVALPPYDQNDRLVLRYGDKRGVETDLDSRRLRAGLRVHLTIGIDGRSLQLRGRVHAFAPV